MRRPASRRDRLIQGQIELTDIIYGAVLQPGRWSDLMGSVRRILGGCPALIYREGWPRRTRAFLASGLDPAFERSYIEHYAALNPWEIATQGVRPPMVANDELLEQGALERSEFYTGWCRPQDDLRFTINISAPIGEEQAIELVDTRPRREGPFDADECRLMSSLIPHLQRAARLQNMLVLADATQTAMARTFGRLGTGLLLVDASLRVLFMDHEAELILAGGGGLRIRGGRLMEAAAVKGRLSEAILRATGQGKTVLGRTGTQITLPRGSDARPLSVSVAPLDERDRPCGLAGPLAMVVLSVPERTGGPHEKALRTFLGLTQAEARLVAALCDGHTLATYAQASGISLNTAKTHLKHVFDKVGVTRQADLIRRVTSDMALRLTQ